MPFQDIISLLSTIRINIIKIMRMGIFIQQVVHLKVLLQLLEAD